MAFTGTAAVKQISDRIVRITGLSLVAGATGTIGLFANSGSPGVRLPEAFKTIHYAAEGSNVPFQDCIECTTKAAATGVATAIPLAVVKSGSTTLDFLITLTNTHGTLASPDQEIMVRFHD
jgi:hypothetical protein